MTSSFVTDRDTVRSVPVVVTTKSLSDGVATLTTLSNHGFDVGNSVDVRNVGQQFDGTFTISRKSATSFSYRVNASNVVETTVEGGTAVSPSPAFVRFSRTDKIVESIGSKVSLRAEFWDYNTVKVSWTVDSVVDSVANTDILYGRVPRIAITRSTFGRPTTPLDGTQVLNERYVDAVPGTNRQLSVAFFQTQPAREDNSFNRPTLGTGLALYDRNLRPGVWYYYSAFLFLCGDADELSWRWASSASALTPSVAGHGTKIFELLPPYYQSKDQEFTPGTNRSGDLKRFTSLVGVELDYTKTLADSLEHVYDIDCVAEPLMLLLGDGNLGLDHEHSLGTIRYRSLLAAASQLYDERGSARGVRDMVFSSTKYRCKILEGINRMNLTDDAEFAAGTGSWGDLGTAGYTSLVGAESWVGWSSTPASELVSASIEAVSLSTAVSVRRNALKVTPASSEASHPVVVVACGLGSGEVLDRHKKSSPQTFYPRLHGIRCTPGNIYWFSAYSSRLPDQERGVIEVGIMWFNDSVARADFAVDGDYISKNKFVADDPESVSNPPSLTRYSVSSEAPLSRLGQPYVYAIPYLAFSNTSTRYVSSCMFYDNLNSALDFTIDTDTPLLTLGVADETLGSVYKLGDV